MREITVGANPTAATLTTLYTVPTGYYAKVVLMRVANATAANKHVTFDWVDASASATYSVVYQSTVSAKTTYDWGGTSYFVMEEGDSLKVTTESASTFAVLVTIELEGAQRQ